MEDDENSLMDFSDCLQESSMLFTHISCIKVNGKPVLPPLMTVKKRQEMKAWREKAMEVEAIIRERRRSSISSDGISMVEAKSTPARPATLNLSRQQIRKRSPHYQQTLEHRLALDLQSESDTESERKRWSPLKVDSLLELRLDAGGDTDTTQETPDTVLGSPRLIRQASYTVLTPSSVLQDCYSSVPFGVNGVSVSDPSIAQHTSDDSKLQSSSFRERIDQEQATARSHSGRRTWDLRSARHKWNVSCRLESDSESESRPRIPTENCHRAKSSRMRRPNSVPSFQRVPCRLMSPSPQVSVSKSQDSTRHRDSSQRVRIPSTRDSSDHNSASLAANREQLDGQLTASAIRHNLSSANDNLDHNATIASNCDHLLSQQSIVSSTRDSLDPNVAVASPRSQMHPQVTSVRSKLTQLTDVMIALTLRHEEQRRQLLQIQEEERCRYERMVTSKQRVILDFITSPSSQLSIKEPLSCPTSCVEEERFDLASFLSEPPLPSKQMQMQQKPASSLNEDCAKQNGHTPRDGFVSAMDTDMDVSCMDDQSVPLKDSGDDSDSWSLSSTSSTISNEDASQKNLVIPQCYQDEDFDLYNKAAAVLCAAVKGYLTRRLWHTEPVRALRRSLHESLKLSVILRSASDLRSGDLQLINSLQRQINSDWETHYDTFMNEDVGRQMAMIAADRERLRAQKAATPNSGGRRMSAATLKSLQRKQSGMSTSLSFPRTASFKRCCSKMSKSASGALPPDK